MPADDFIVVLTTPDMRTIRLAVGRTKEQLHEAVRLGINATLLDIDAFTKMRLSGDVLNVGTGAGRASVRVQEMEEGGKGGEITVGSGLEYMRAHEYGVPRGSVTIRPRTAQALHFFVDGREVFAKSVQMYLPERPYFRPSIDEAIPRLPGHVGRELNRLVTLGGTK